MDNFYLQELILEAKSRGGGMLLNYEDKPAAVVLTIDMYNQLLQKLENTATAVLETQSLSQNQMPKKKSQVLVTGGAGYIGGHLVRELIKAGYQVVVLDNLSTGKREHIDPKAVFFEGDLADVNLLKDIFLNNNFEAVFHMAASLEVEESVREPVKYFQNNVVNLSNLLIAMAEANVKKIIFSSSAAVYGEPEKNPVKENAPLHPNNPYGYTKLLGERLIKYYCEFAGFIGVAFRYFNACGFDPAAKIVPTHQTHLIYNVMMVAKGAKPYLEVFGNTYNTSDGTCIRDYVHVLDIVLPHILALGKMNRKAEFRVFNIGTSHGFSVAQVANSASEVLNRIIPMEIGPKRPGDAPVTVADNEKLRTELGYHLTHSSLENIMATSWEVMKDI